MNEPCRLRCGERYETCDDEDGGLIGGASLKPVDFTTIVNAANQEPQR